VRIVPGPDLDDFARAAIDALTSAPYRILASSDRVGTRLEGRRVSRVEGRPERSRPMVRGAIEVPRDEQPIVLGPEHPTTGGYPLVAVIATSDLGRFHSIPLGGTVRFVVC
jgi:allophanate hydrolase subunit 2